MSTHSPMTPIDFHVLLVLSQGPLYGYAVKKALGEESEGAIDPEIGSLYRVIGRLVSAGLVEQAEGPASADDAAHPGRPRKYYALTIAGEEALRHEATRLHGAVALARRRGMITESGG
jgi:PadR family transcriptional regulator PadR